MDEPTVVTGAICSAFGLIAWLCNVPLRSLRARRATEPIRYVVVLELELGEALARAQAAAVGALRAAGFELEHARSDELRWRAPREHGDLRLDELLGGRRGPGLTVRGTILGASTALEVIGIAPVAAAERLRGLVLVPAASRAPVARPAVATQAMPLAVAAGA